MKRFAVRYPTVTEGQKHSEVLFSTDTDATVRYWLGNMDEHFCVVDNATGKVLWNIEDYEVAIGAVPLAVRDWSIYGDVNDLGEGDEPDFDSLP